MPSDIEVLKLITDQLARLESKVDAGMATLFAKLDAKADKADLAKIEGELHGQSNRLRDLERSRDEQHAAAEAHARLLESQARRRQWAIPVLLTSVYTIVVVLQAIGVL